MEIFEYKLTAIKARSNFIIWIQQNAGTVHNKGDMTYLVHQIFCKYLKRWLFNAKQNERKLQQSTE